MVVMEQSIKCRSKTKNKERIKRHKVINKWEAFKSVHHNSGDNSKLLRKSILNELAKHEVYPRDLEVILNSKCRSFENHWGEIELYLDGRLIFDGIFYKEQFKYIKSHKYLFKTKVKRFFERILK